MVINLKKNATPQQITQALSTAKPTGKVIDAKQFAGKVKWGQDALAYQRELRGE
jgi:hypothetical protein